MNYYEIGLNGDRHWKKSVFTYASSTPLEKGSIVVVPFGNSQKNGIVIKKSIKPQFETKKVTSVSTIKLQNTNMVFLKWYADFYGNMGSALFGQFLPSYLTKNIQEVTVKKPQPRTLSLSKGQIKCIEEIKSTEKPTILHGITGSGKTRIYIHLLKECLSKDKNGLLLYPEISLTSQILTEFKKHFPVIAFHSELTDAERSKLWYTVANSREPMVIIGPRSALFLPHNTLGTIIIDEAHEASYKQDSDIHYNSLFVAAGLASINKSKLVLGSATPPINETELIEKSGGNIVCLHEKAIKSSLKTHITVVDIRKREKFTKHNLISDKLIEITSAALRESKQILLFINRRGTAKVVTCNETSCDWQATCPKCDLPLTYHHDRHSLLCHTCGFRSPMIHQCPVCNGQIEQKSLGSKALVEDVKKLFPNATIARFDSDNLKQDSYANLHEQVVDGKIDILIGTQQIIKGLDLPKLGVVGIINADLSLHFPDYSSDERTFQIIAQSIGRVDRGHQTAQVVVQTFQPNNPVIQQAISSDWHAFRADELNNRKTHSFPPYSYYAKIIFRDKNIATAMRRANAAKKQIEKSKSITVKGPLECFYAKKGLFYYVQLLCSAHKRNYLLQIIDEIQDKAIIDIDPNNLL